MKGKSVEEIVLPKWGVTMQEATVTEWLVSVGDRIEVGQPVATVETDKVDGEVESPAAGMITEILVEAGQQVAVGAVLANLDTA